MGAVAVIAVLSLYGWATPVPMPTATPDLAPTGAVNAPAPPVPPAIPAPTPLLATPVTAKTPPVPLYRRWWFWTILGGFAAASAATVYFTSRSPPGPYVGNLQPGVWTLP